MLHSNYHCVEKPRNVCRAGVIYWFLFRLQQGRQEDAEEFLSCVLNGLHDEMVSAVNAASGKPAQGLSQCVICCQSTVTSSTMELKSDDECCEVTMVVSCSLLQRKRCAQTET